MEFHNSLDHRESQTGAAFPGSEVGFEYPVQIFRSDAGAVIAETRQHPPQIGFGLDHNLAYGIAFFGKNRVLNQVDPHLSQLQAVSMNENWLRREMEFDLAFIFKMVTQIGELLIQIINFQL